MDTKISNYFSLSYDEQLELLKKELNKIEHEIKISQLIYSYHGSDSYEDLFRDNIPLLKEKYDGILYAIEELQNQYKNTK
jgi:hypothetical protein